MYYVYFLTNKCNTALYIGITNDIKRRVREHKTEIIDGYTKRLHLYKLVYLEEFHHPQDAIAREKQLKRWKREKKNALVNAVNPHWQDWSLLL